MIIRKGKILNENGEWEDYIEEDDPERPPIAFTYMGTAGLEIESDDEVVDFCMQYRIPRIEGLEKCAHNLKVSSDLRKTARCLQNLISFILTDFFKINRNWV